MRTVTVMAGQTLADVAIQECGALEAVWDIAEINGVSTTSELVDGDVLKLPDKVYNAKRQEYCTLNKVRPATEVTGDICRVFTEEFTKEFI